MFFFPIYQIQSMFYVRAKWNEKWFHSKNKDSFEYKSSRVNPKWAQMTQISSPSLAGCRRLGEAVHACTRVCGSRLCLWGLNA